MDDDAHSPRSPAASDRPRARIAAIVPCHDDGAFVPEAVSSLIGLDGVEVTVVDDGSTDLETQRALSSLEAQGVTVLHQDNAGLSAARMAGVRASSAPYIYNLDADDLAGGDALARMADLLDRDQAAAVCFGDYEEFGDSRLLRLVPRTIDPFRLAYTNEYPVTAMFRRGALESTGGWRQLGSGYEDWNLWMALAERGLAAVYAGPGVITFRKRVHGERMLAAAKTDHRALYRALRQEHPRLFADVQAHRRASELSLPRKLLYPIVYGGRRRFRFERRVKAWLDRTGIWTLRG